MQLPVIYPPNLQKGSTVAIVCPSGFLALEKVQNCIATLHEWGFQVVLGKTVGHQHHYFAGTDKERLIDFQSMLDNTAIDAIICGRGGYGISKIVDGLNFEQFKKYPKWIIGFSDITLLHSHLYNTVNISSIHGPMVNAFNHKNQLSYTNTIHEVLLGKAIQYTCPSNNYNIYGKANGILIGGNLTMLVHSIGTPSFYKPSNNYILCIEDIGEHLYAIERMLVQLKRIGFLKNLKALIVGGFSDTKDTDIPFGKILEQIIIDLVAEYKYPVCFGFPISHATENVAVKLGVAYSITIDEGETCLKEL